VPVQHPLGRRPPRSRRHARPGARQQRVQLGRARGPEVPVPRQDDAPQALEDVRERLLHRAAVRVAGARVDVAPATPGHPLRHVHLHPVPDLRGHQPGHGDAGPRGRPLGARRPHQVGTCTERRRLDHQVRAAGADHVPHDRAAVPGERADHPRARTQHRPQHVVHRVLRPRTPCP
jgi:hypothetical protein